MCVAHSHDLLLLRPDSRLGPSSVLLRRLPCFVTDPSRSVFWEEGGQQPFALKIAITRPPEASLPAFVRHFEDLIDTYSDIHIINLLSAEKEGEIALTRAYESHLKAAGQVEEAVREHVEMTHFDFHAKSRLGGIESVKAQLASTVGSVEEVFGATIVTVDEKGGGSLVVGQRGAFRTNCKGERSSCEREDDTR